MLVNKMIKNLASTILFGAIVTVSMFSATAVNAQATIPQPPTSTIFLPIVNKDGITVNTEFRQPIAVSDLEVDASDFDILLRKVPTEGKAIDFVNNDYLSITEHKTLTSTGNVDVHEIGIELGDLRVVSKAYEYTYHTQTSDSGKFQLRAYMVRKDGSIWILSATSTYDAAALAKIKSEDLDGQYHDAYLLLNTLVDVELLAQPNFYFTSKLNP